MFGMINNLFNRDQNRTYNKGGMSGGVPTVIAPEAYSDDFSFCRGFNGLNIAITGSSGTIGKRVADTLLKYS